MSIISLFGAMKNYDKGLSKISMVVNKTLGELGIAVKEINLGPPTSIPTYDGIQSQAAMEIMTAIRGASGVVFCTTASFCGVSSVMQNFLEHLEADKNVLAEKNCMIIIMGEDNEIMNGFAKALNNIGAYDSVRIMLDNNYFKNPHNAKLIEKQVEDFYRMVRQKRKFYTKAAGLASAQAMQPPQPPQPTQFTYDPYSRPEDSRPPYEYNQPPQDVYAPSQQNNQPPAYNYEISKPQFETIQTDNNVYQGPFNPAQSQQPVSQYREEPPRPANVTPYNNESIIDNFNRRQSEDVQEITNFFSKKQLAEPLMATNPAPVQHKTPRQLTAGLVHHYQPQLAGDLNCTIQINVTGRGGFDGYLLIKGTDCYYYDGNVNAPTLTVLSDEKNWVDVVTGKVSAQKAFMTGSLKIKGNFVILTRFDQIFNTSKNYK